MEDIKEYLDDDASEKNRRAADQIEEGLAALRLQQKVKTAATERAKWQRTRRWWQGSLILLLLTAGLSWRWINNTKEDLDNIPSINSSQQKGTIHPPDSSVIKQLQEAPSPIPEEPANEPIKPQEPTSPPPNIPIAQATPDPVLPPPAYGAPDTYLRGQSEEDENKALLDQLWYTSYPLKGLKPGEKFVTIDQLLRDRKFPIAYVRLQQLDRLSTPNDTLRYLQAYTFLEMGQGEEATRLIDQLEKPPRNWQAQIAWYRGLALLLADETNAALVVFKEIAAQADHPYYLQAQKAVELYE